MHCGNGAGPCNVSSSPFFVHCSNCLPCSPRQILTAWGVHPRAAPELTGRLKAKADVGEMTEAQRKADPHLSATKFTAGLVRNTSAVLMGMPEVRALVERHRAELGY